MEIRNVSSRGRPYSAQHVPGGSERASLAAPFVANDHEHRSDSLPAVHGDARGGRSAHCPGRSGTHRYRARWVLRHHLRLRPGRPRDASCRGWHRLRVPRCLAGRQRRRGRCLARCHPGLLRATQAPTVPDHRQPQYRARLCLSPLLRSALARPWPIHLPFLSTHVLGHHIRPTGPMEASHRLSSAQRPGGRTVGQPPRARPATSRGISISPAATQPTGTDSPSPAADK